LDELQSNRTEIPSPTELLSVALQRAEINLDRSLISDAEIESRIETVCRDMRNRSPARLLLACALAKAHRPEIDIRKPYTEIHDADAYSGRTYDERYIATFINENRLPCNSTTAFLTPFFRKGSSTSIPEMPIVGRTRDLYRIALQLLTDVQTGKVSAADLLAETIRWLLIVRNEKFRRMETLLAGLGSGITALSSEGIVSLIEQHLNIPGGSRLPVLVVAAAYQAAENHLGERVLPLHGHNAADKQTEALGDVEITLVDDQDVVTCYEMKRKPITQNDIDNALHKLMDAGTGINNYIFITTEAAEQDVREYAAMCYERTGGIEVVILYCIEFLRHFLHLFHRLRSQFLEAYQRLLLAEPDSAVSQPVKEAFLALRQAAESSSSLNFK
jgi:hypothetical protein